MTNEPGHAHLDPLVHVDQPDVPTREADARAWAGKAIRDLGHALVGHHLTVEQIDRVGTTLDALAEELRHGAPRQRDTNRQEGWMDPPADGQELFGFDERPISGRSSPWGLDLHIRRVGDEIVAQLTLGAAHEGAPGRSHGGIVAALFDDVYGFVLDMMGTPAFTGELGVRYEAGTPIGVPLECRVRLLRQEGRKLFMHGELTHEGKVIARSTATFITIPLDHFRDRTRV